jgi:protocatechuate 3,4-dioxygenase beta subunit
MKPPRLLFLAATVAVLACGVAHLQAQSPQASTNATMFKGTIVGADGKPVAGAVVEYWQYGEGLDNPFLPNPSTAKPARAESGADGAFSFPLSSKAGMLVAKKPGLAPAWKILNPGPNFPRETETKLEMTTPGILEGTIIDESNRPVAGAEAYALMAIVNQSQGEFSWNALFGPQARGLFSARTDAAGHFRIENFPSNARAMLAAEIPGKISRPSEEAAQDLENEGYRAGQTDIKLQLEPAGSVDGQVAGENSRPMAAQLTLIPDSEHGFVPARTPEKSGTNGIFHFSQVLAGSYNIRASFGTDNDSGWVAEPVPVTVKAGQAVHGVQIKAVRGTLLEVTVLSQTGRKPQAGVHVAALQQDSRSQSLTGSNGVAKLYVLPGDYQVSAVQGPTLSGQAPAKVEADKTNRVEVELSESPVEFSSGPTEAISGMVQMPDGKPAAGISVRLISSGQGDRQVRTDANGKFELRWNPRMYGSLDMTPCILARDAERNLAGVQEIDETTTNLVLQLAPGLTLAGRVESGGKPVTNATANLVFWTGRSGSWLRGLARTNIPGHFEIPALPPGRKYGVVVSAPGYGQTQNNSLEISTAPGRQELDKVELKLANLPLAGQVLDDDDKPVARCYVGMHGDNQPSANVRTDREGRFKFDGVCAGTIQLSANSQQNYGNTSAQGGDTNVVLRLGQTMGSYQSKSQKLKGMVTDAEGKPLQGAQVAVFPNRGRGWVKTGTNGEYSLSWSLESWQMRGGDPLFVVRDKARNLAKVEELSEEATNLNVKVRPAMVVAGQVKNSDGKPMAAAQVGLWLKAGNSYEQLEQQPSYPVNAEGRFEITCLPREAEYIVYASAKDYGRVQQQLEPEYDTNRLELPPFVLMPADSVIAGQVLNDDDKPVSGVNVNLNGEGQPSGHVATDSKGRFQFKVCKGEIRLYAYPQNGGASAQATVEAGDTNIVMNLRSYSSQERTPPRRPSLRGNPLPDLASVNLASDTAPAGQSVLLCLFDAGQRPSRHLVKQLEQQVAALKSKNVCVLGVQAIVTTDEIFNQWKDASPVSFPVGRVTEASDKTKWASTVSALPWFILTDANHRVISDGFEFSELDAEIKKLTK